MRRPDDFPKATKETIAKRVGYVGLQYKLGSLNRGVALRHAAERMTIAKQVCDLKMLPGQKIEYEILKLAEYSEGNWRRGCSVYPLGRIFSASIANCSPGQVEDAFIRLWKKGVIRLQKYPFGSSTPRPFQGEEDAGRFFYGKDADGTDFEFKVTPEGRLYYEELLDAFKTEETAEIATPVTKKPMEFEAATSIYRAERSIGDGGSGTVYLVKDADGEAFALKLLRSNDTKKRKRFSNELRFCLERQHPNIIRVLDHGAFEQKGNGAPFYVMPYYERTLRDLMTSIVSPDSVLPLFTQILDGLEAAHLKGVIHRDLKPENVLYDAASDHVVVADFGIAHFEEDELFTAIETQDQERLANFTYAAPEQRVRGGEIDERTDIFALGLILNEMFTRTVPLGVGHPLIGSATAKFSYLDEFVARMIRHSREERPSSIARVKEELEELIARGNEFVARQRLDALRQVVVPASDPDDPLRGMEVQVVGFDYLPENPGTLAFTLKPAPPPLWIQTLHNLESYRSYRGLAEPRMVTVIDNRAAVPATEQIATGVAQMFKEWVVTTNKKYQEKIRAEARHKEREERERIADEQRLAEEKARVLQKLRETAL